MKYVLILRRKNGRFVKQLGDPFPSRYAAKQSVVKWQETYDEKTYDFTVEETDGRR